MPKWPLAEKSNRIMSIKIIITIVLVAMSMPIGDVMADPSTRIQPCPKSPNCVCSDEPNESTHYIDPIASIGWEPMNAEESSSKENGQRLLAAIARYLESHDEFKIIEQTDDSLKAEATTPILRFVDDIDMQVRGARVFVRSASRLGYSDLGKNRRRVEKMRAAMAEAGMAQPLSP